MGFFEEDIKTNVKNLKVSLLTRFTFTNKQKPLTIFNYFAFSISTQKKNHKTFFDKDLIQNGKLSFASAKK